MRSIIKNPIHKIEYNKKCKITVVYTDYKECFYFDKHREVIIVEELTPEGKISKGVVLLKNWEGLQVYKDCFLLYNNRGGLIYA